jgi:hypothetical protein
MSTNTGYKTRWYRVQGVLDYFTGHCERFGLSAVTARSQLARKKPVHEIFGLPESEVEFVGIGTGGACFRPSQPTRGRMYRVNGVLDNIAGHCRRYGVDYRTAIQRRHVGRPLHSILGVPRESVIDEGARGMNPNTGKRKTLEIAAPAGSANLYLMGKFGNRPRVAA